MSATMELQVNGHRREVPSDVTISGLLELLAVPVGRVAVEVNTQVVPKARHPSTVLRPNDVVEVVTFVGGG